MTDPLQDDPFAPVPVERSGDPFVAKGAKWIAMIVVYWFVFMVLGLITYGVWRLIS